MSTPPKAQARQSGGMNQMLGQFDDEHLEANAMSDAFAQKAISQQAADPAAAPTATGTSLPTAAQPTPPREIGSIKDELIIRPIKDIVKGLASFFDINALLGIKSDDTPEKQMKKKQLHSRWQQLDQEQQAVAREKYQQEMKKKQQAEQEKQMKKQQEEQQQAQAIAPPSSPKKGPVGQWDHQKSSKSNIETMMEMSRKTMSTPQGAN